MHHPSQFAQRALPVLLRLFSSLPLAVIHSIGRAGGRLLYALPGGYRRHVQRNAAQAGFEAPRFARQAAAETGAMMSELPRVWFRSDACMAQVTCEDWHVIEEALAERNGLIMLTPHLGCFELAARYMAQRIPLTIMFRPHRKAVLRGLLDAVRATSNLKGRCQQPLKAFDRSYAPCARGTRSAFFPIKPRRATVYGSRSLAGRRTP